MTRAHGASSQARPLCPVTSSARQRASGFTGPLSAEDGCFHAPGCNHEEGHTPSSLKPGPNFRSEEWDCLSLSHVPSTSPNSYGQKGEPREGHGCWGGAAGGFPGEEAPP